MTTRWKRVEPPGGRWWRSRRRDGHRPPQPGAPAPWLRRREVLWGALFTLLFATLAGLIGLPAQGRPRYGLGQVLPEPIVARAGFTAIDADATRLRRIDAHDREPAIYVPNTRYREYLRSELDWLISKVGNPAYANYRDLPEADRLRLRQDWNFEDRGGAEERWQHFKAQRWVASNGVPQPAWYGLRNHFLDMVFGVAMLTPEQADLERDPEDRAPAIRLMGPEDDPRQPGNLRADNDIVAADPHLLGPLREKLSPAVVPWPTPLRSTVEALLLRPPPVEERITWATYLRHEELTRAARQARAAAEPEVAQSFRANDLVLPEGISLSEADLALLERERQAYQAALAAGGPHHPGRPLGLIAALGHAGQMLLVSLVLWGYTLAYNERIARNPIRGLALAGLLLLALAMAVAGTSAYPRLLFLTATAPTLFAGMVLAIAYDRRFALAVGAIHTLLVTLTLDLGVGFALSVLVGLGVGVGLLDEVRTRSKLALNGLWAGLALAVATLLIGAADRPLLLPRQFNQLGFDALLALAAALGGGALVQVLLPAIEKLFRVTTALTLRELNDATHPLLRRLAQDAPGTYQHSLRMGDLAEAAANAIGADALLCRVGAMYHDIGKVNKPLYFVENQGGGPNRHNKLSPAMSLLIIVAHVKDGVEMAREARLPQSIKHFIESHHGTTLVEYFYHAAQQRRDEGDAPVSEFEFRYPGPKPQTREAAIMMICDAVEGASRALPDPSPARFAQLVHTLAHRRLSDGQFDECNLTLEDLHRIEEAIVKTLNAMYHGRIAYPRNAESAATPSPATPAAS